VYVSTATTTPLSVFGVNFGTADMVAAAGLVGDDAAVSLSIAGLADMCFGGATRARRQAQEYVDCQLLARRLPVGLHNVTISIAGQRNTLAANATGAGG
jgi:hypothetical protein